MDAPSPSLNNALLFPIAFSGAIVAALLVAAWLTVRSGSIGAALMPAAVLFLLALIYCLVAFSLIGGLMNLLRPRIRQGWLCFAVFVLLGLATVGAAPFIVGWAFPIPVRVAAVVGAAGAFASAALWMYLERHPHVSAAWVKEAP